MTQQTVTIIMSNYNQARYLHQSLGAICTQKRPADKILVFDDGSTDASVDIIRGWEAARRNLRLIRNKRNIGLQASIKRALPLVTTDCLAWAASDDVLEPDFIGESMALLERYPQAGLCFSELTVLRGDSGVIQPFAQEPSVAHVYDLSDLPEYLSPGAVAARMKRSYFPPSSNTVVVRKKALMECGGFQAPLQWHSDSFAYNVVAARYGACVVPKTLALLRAREESYSASGMRAAHLQRPVLEAMLDLIRSDAYRDIRRLFRKAPSFYSVWGVSIIPLMARRVRMWPTMIAYSAWKIREHKLGHRITWARTAGHVVRGAYASLATRIGVRPVMLTSPFRFRQNFNRLRQERDALAGECARLNSESDARVIEIDALSGQVEVLTAESSRMQVAIDELEQTLERDRKAFAAERRRIRARERARKVAFAAERRDLSEQNDTLFREREQALSAKMKAVGERDNAVRTARRERDILSRRLDTALMEKRQVEMRLEESGAAAEEVGEDAGEDRLPSLLITTMPKSGTYYLSSLLSAGLGLSQMIVSNQYFPYDVIYQPKLRRFVRGGRVSQDHFDAGKINVELIARHAERIVVHLRDPRQALLSHVHYLCSDRFRENEKETLLFIYPQLPDGFFDMVLDRRIDWGIAQWMPLLVEWVEGWLRVSEAGPLTVKFTRFEDLIANEQAFVGEVLDFFEIPRQRFGATEIALTQELHFRKGEADEWASVFSEAQKRRAAALIPPRLAERFGWTLEMEPAERPRRKQAQGQGR